MLKITRAKLCEAISNEIGVGETCSCCEDLITAILKQLNVQIVDEIQEQAAEKDDITQGGIKCRYHIVHTDGTPVSGRFYFVLNPNSSDQIHAKACLNALFTYSHYIKHYNPQLAKEIEAQLDIAMENMREQQKGGE